MTILYPLSLLCLMCLIHYQINLFITHLILLALYGFYHSSGAFPRNGEARRKSVGNPHYVIFPQSSQSEHGRNWKSISLINRLG
ncbi:hypothetical protein BC941DRAFT_431298 [Chlamydoabsidia padenii]|nr:hypothetical protein BC941DRAFT_431298 [Chlamydoabsidia padenii]